MTSMCAPKSRSFSHLIYINHGDILVKNYIKVPLMHRCTETLLLEKEKKGTFEISQHFCR